MCLVFSQVRIRRRGFPDPHSVLFVAFYEPLRLRCYNSCSPHYRAGVFNPSPLISTRCPSILDYSSKISYRISPFSSLFTLPSLTIPELSICHFISPYLIYSSLNFYCPCLFFIIVFRMPSSLVSLIHNDLFLSFHVMPSIILFTPLWAL